MFEAVAFHDIFKDVASAIEDESVALRVPLENVVSENILRGRVEANDLGDVHHSSYALVAHLDPGLDGDYVDRRDEWSGNVHGLALKSVDCGFRGVRVECSQASVTGGYGLHQRVGFRSSDLSDDDVFGSLSHGVLEQVEECDLRNFSRDSEASSDY